MKSIPLPITFESYIYVKDFKNTLSELNELTFVPPNGSHIAPHFHLTEDGEITKSYVDCGGYVRLEKNRKLSAVDGR